MRLKDKVAIVTGAASGIGKEIAKAFVHEGARVVIADLNQKAADAAAAELGDTRKALGVVMDVTDEQQVEAGVARTIEQFGKIDVLVSNAGIQIVAPLDEFKFADWKRLLSIHLDGAFLTTRAVLQRAEKASGLARRRALSTLATQLGTDARGSSDQAKVQVLIAAVNDLGK